MPQHNDPHSDENQVIRVYKDDGKLGSFDHNCFTFDNQPAALAIAYISPYVDFTCSIQTLKSLAQDTPLIGVSTSGELYADTAGPSLYTPFSRDTPSIVLQVFSPDVIADVSIWAVPLFSEDLRASAPKYTNKQRVNKIVNALLSCSPPFPINARDTFALCFSEGYSPNDSYLMEAVYEAGIFPCPFIGGSAATDLTFKSTYLYDNTNILENHSVMTFIKLAPGKRYSVLKSQNFQKTSLSFIAVDVELDTCTVSTLLDPTTDTVRPATEALASALKVDASEIGNMLKSFSFGIELDNEIYVRSVSKVNLGTGELHFFCNINQGDELFLLRPTDIIKQTKSDIDAFLKDKPAPLGVILNDCVMRRFNNIEVIPDFPNHWPCPTAGFSTFGELLGISINQTLTALAFFNDTDVSFHDSFIDNFPIHYAHYQDFFRLSELRRIEVTTRLRADMTRRFTQHLGASSELAGQIEGMLGHGVNLRDCLNNIRLTISREVASEKRAEKAEQHLMDAIEAMSEGFVLYDKDGYLILSNSRLRNMFTNGSTAFAPGTHMSDIIRDLANGGAYSDDDESVTDYIERRIKAHETPDGQTTLQKMGNGKWMTTRLNRTRDGGVVGIRTDVTDIKQRENELEELKRSYETILRTAGDGIIGIDTYGNVSFANPAALNTLKCKESAVKDIDYKKALGAFMLPDFHNLADKAISGECTCSRQDQTVFTAEYILSPAYENGKINGAVLVFRDITLRKSYEGNVADQQRRLEQEVLEHNSKLSEEISARIKMDSALQQSQQRLLGITSSLLEGVLLIDSMGLIMFANPSAYGWLGSDVLLERHVDEIFTLDEGGTSIPFASSPFSKVINTGYSIEDNDAMFSLSNGKKISVAYSVSLLNESRARQVAVLSFRNIKTLKNAQRKAMQASRLASVGQLATGVAHEINTPMQYVGDNLHFIQDTFKDITSAIDAFSQSLNKDISDDILNRHNIPFLLADYPDAINQALQGVEHVTHIVKSMKDFAHPGSSIKVCIDVRQAIESTMTVCRNEWKQVATIHTDFDDEVGNILCFAADLNQVLLNLIVNAAHAIAEFHTESKGNIWISTRRDGQWIEIRVTDDGPGVPKKLRERIFAPFFTTKPIGKGTGQGLSICQDIIAKKHEGQLFLDEAIGPGSSFVIRLPAIFCA